MNEFTITGGDLLTFVAAIALSCALGGLYRLRGNMRRQRRAVELGERDLKALADRCDRQQMGMARLDQEVMDMRQAMLQQALALMPMRSAVPVANVAPAAAEIAPRKAPGPQPVPEVRAQTAAERALVRPGAQAPADQARAVAPTPIRRTAAARPPQPAAAGAKPQKTASVAPARVSVNPVQLARDGASADALMRRCGLSRAEADLVLSVHGAAVARREA